MVSSFFILIFSGLFLDWFYFVAKKLICVITDFFKLSKGSAEERKTYQDSYNMYYNYEKLIHERYDNEEDAKLNEERIWQMRFIG